MTHLPMINNDEAVELLDYIAMNDQRTHMTLKEMLSQQCNDNPGSFGIFRILRTIMKTSFLTNPISLGALSLVNKKGSFASLRYILYF
jgi:hypothetical protein